MSNEPEVQQHFNGRTQQGNKQINGKKGVKHAIGENCRRYFQLKTCPTLPLSPVYIQQGKGKETIRYFKIHHLAAHSSEYHNSKIEKQKA